MPYIVTAPGLVASRALAAQWDFIVNSRTAHDAHESDLTRRHNLAANMAQIPADVWRDFDRNVKMLMTGDEMQGLVADLEPLTRNVHVGRIVSEYRQFGGAELGVRSSIDGQHAKPVNNTSYDVDGALVLVHSTQVGRTWRELEGMRAEGYDGLSDDQTEAVRYVRRRMADDFVNGTANLTYKGYQSYGIKSHPNSLALNLGAGGVNIDLTSASLTYGDAAKAFIAALRTLQGGSNNAVGNVTFYVSEAIWFNLMRPANPTPDTVGDSMLTLLMRIPGIAAIKKSDAVSGNEFFAIILSSEYIRPVIGMPVTSTPITRTTPMDDFNVLVWSASGLQVKADAQGRSGVLYAKAA